MRTSVAALAAGATLLTGCTRDADGPATTTPPSPATSPRQPVPDSYQFVLTSSCGERALLGDYLVVVDGGRVTSVANLNEDYPYDPEPSEVPTLADLLHLARSAPPEAVVELTVDDSGLPRSLSLDPVPNGIDDEECYRVSELEIGVTSATP